MADDMDQMTNDLTDEQKALIQEQDQHDEPDVAEVVEGE